MSNFRLSWRRKWSHRVLAAMLGLFLTLSVGSSKIEAKDHLGQPSALFFIQQRSNLSKTNFQLAATPFLESEFQQYYTGQIRPALEAFQKMRIQYQATQNRAGEARALVGIAGCYDWLGDYQNSLKAAQEALAIYQSIADQAGEAEALQGIASAYLGLEQPEQSLAYFQQALAIQRQIQNRQGEGWSLGLLGLVQLVQGQLQAGMESLQQSRQILQGIEQPTDLLAYQYQKGLVWVYTSQGYFQLKQFDQAEIMLNQALILSREFHLRPVEAYSSMLLGLLYSEQQQYPQAAEYFQQAAEIFQQIGRLTSATENWLQLGFSYIKQQQYVQAKSAFQQALEAIHGTDNPQLEVEIRVGIGQADQMQAQQLLIAGSFQEGLVAAQNSLEAFRIAQNLLQPEPQLRQSSYQQGILTSISQSYLIAASAYSFLEQYAEAIAAAQQSLSAIERLMPDQEYQSRYEVDKIRSFQSLIASHNSLARQFEEATDLQKALLESQKALGYAEQYLDFTREVSNSQEEHDALLDIRNIRSNIGTVYTEQQNYKQAIEEYQAVLERDQQLNAPDLQSDSLRNLALAHLGLGQYDLALQNFYRALEVARSIPDQSREAVASSGIGIVYDELGEEAEAIQQYQPALALAQGQGDRLIEAEILNLLSKIELEKGNHEQALQGFQQALETHQDIARQLQQADAIDRLAKLCPSFWDETSESSGETSLDAYIKRARAERAQKRCSQTARTNEGITLNNIGLTYSNLKRYPEAITAYNQSLEIAQEQDSRRDEAITQNNLGIVFLMQQNYEQARDWFQRALATLSALGNNSSLITIRGNLAQTYLAQGNLTDGLRELDRAINGIEEVRREIKSDELRASYFATTQNYYQAKIQTLMQFNRGQEAFDVSEASRARTLIELLATSGVDPDRATTDPELKALYDRKQELESQLAAYEVLIQNAPLEEIRRQHQQQYRQLESELKDLVEPQIKQKDPAYAAIRYPTPLTLDQVQRNVLDDDTVLLQYAIGEQQSYLWVVPHRGPMTSYTIPHERQAIDNAVYNFRRKVSSVSCDYHLQQDCTPFLQWLVNADGEAKTLTQMILPAGAAQQIAGKQRLLIVADGSLHNLPFAALPDPNMTDSTTYQPLMLTHEVIHTPSASAIAILRQQMLAQKQQGQRPAFKTLAVIADPLFGGADDTRMAALPRKAAAPTQTAAPVSIDQIVLQQALRDTTGRDANLSPILPNRLELTGKTAQTILGMVNDPSQKVEVTGLAANQNWVTQPGNLAQYQHVLFATHGIFNSDQPEQSGIVLSLVDRNGEPQDGYLTLRELFNLKLNAELVVLSACQSGQGENVRGEGIVGITRGFFYAGAERLIATLWDISAEQPTDQFLTTLYSKLLKEALSPTIAFHQTQQAMFQKYPDPYYWAAFTIQGEWKS